VRVISKKPLRDFWERHPEARPALEDWFRKASAAEAQSFPQLRQTFGSADYVDGFTIFDVGALVSQRLIKRGWSVSSA
jgi:mRNA interferase HigB